ncbi:type VII secretion-associated protein, Rv3446c family, C-terminal domain protein [Mycolicibacterium flavescens]|uniref:type VII secretion-associated protein n=1 Tax=Mycobacterium neumannii TaxID=2048551 RepID=UPI000B93EAFF|nr:type VII secretion-associated protein [Mycobacterium neumannii]VEG44919.1 type VII secretion-associated protein, Rv3446c family, C-terminal domain protein [Mycolicibacterium flavescens]
MSRTVVEVGPASIRGANPLDSELVSSALEAIDDDLALVGDEAVPAPELWSQLMAAAVGGADHVVLVCPTWWPSARIDRVREATTATSVEVIRRTAVLQRQIGATVVEIAAELVVVTRPAATAVVIANVDDEVANRVVAAVGCAGPALIDAPAGLEPLANVIAERLRGNGIEVRFAHEDTVRRPEAEPPAPDAVSAGSDPYQPRRAAVLTIVVASTIAICGGFALRGDGDREPNFASTLLMEGRVQVTVPAAWSVQHITSGPGSARAQITSPSDADVALHLTQSVGPPQADLAQTAAALRSALAGEPDDVFVDFNAAGTPAGRAGVTYRELRPDHHVAWTVLVDDGVRIAIGCQSAPGRESTVREVCDQAIRSAHAIS